MEKGLCESPPLLENYGFGRELETGGGVFLAVGIEHALFAGASPKPARKRLDSRTRVRSPSITGGIAS
jgi:hypothetical protein